MSTVPNDVVSSSTGPSRSGDRHGRNGQLRPNTRRTRLLSVLLMIQLVLLVIGPTTWFFAEHNGQLVWHGWNTTPLQLGLAPITLVVFCMWMYRAYGNLPALGARFKPSPGWVVVSIFIPCVNLVVPFLALAEIARWSNPSLADRGRIGRPLGGLTALGWAWASLVNAFAISQLIYDWRKRAVGVTAIATDELSGPVASFLFAQFLVALFLVVRSLNAQQEELQFSLSIAPPGPLPDVSPQIQQPADPLSPPR